MAHGSCHPCSWCNAHKNQLHERGEDRTFGSLNSNFWRYVEDGRNRSQAKKFDNASHPPILQGFHEDMIFLEVIPTPGLHLLIGCVNVLYVGLEKVWPGVAEWTAQCCVEREGYHGGSFTGNGCRKLLNNISKLRTLCPSQQNIYIHSFESLNLASDKIYRLTMKSQLENSRQYFCA